MNPWVLFAIAAMQAGMSIYQTSQQQKAARAARAQAAKEVETGAAAQTYEQQRQRRRQQGAGSILTGYSTPGQQASNQGAILQSSSQEQRSLLGG